MSEKRLIKLRDTYEAFLLDRKAQRFKPSTIRTYEDRLQTFINWCIEGDNATLPDLTPILIKKYFVHLQEKGLASRTIHGIAICIQTFCNWLVSEELVTESPMKKVKVPKADKKILPAFSQEDIKKLLKGAKNERDEAIILFLLDTGVRATELISLKGSDIDIKAGIVTVRQGKGGKDRTVYIGNKVRKQLLRYYMQRGTPKESDSVWLSERTNEPLTVMGLRVNFNKLGKSVGVKNCSPHTFRRTFALQATRNGMSIYHLQRLMGHEDITVLKQYIALAQNDLQQASDKYGVVDNL